MQHDRTPLETAFGPRYLAIQDYRSASAGLEGLGVDTIDRLHDLTRGRLEIARALWSGATSAGVDLERIDVEMLSSLIPPRSYTNPNSSFGDSPEVRFVLFLSHLPTIDRATASLARHAVSAGYAETVRNTPSVDELLSALLVEGLIRVDGADGTEYSMSPLIRTYARRLGAPLQGAGGPTPVRALSKSLTESYRSLLSSGALSISQVLHLAAEFENWDLLARIWTERGTNLFLTDFQAALHAYLSLPEQSLASSPVLAEARSSAWEVSTISRRLGSTDPREILPEASFHVISVPTLAQAIDRVGIDALRGDDIVVAALSSIRAFHQIGDTAAGIAAADEALTLLARDFAATVQPTPFNEARLYIERGILTAMIGREEEALRNLRRAVLLSETTFDQAPYPLEHAYAAFAQLQEAMGRGADCELTLRKFTHLRDGLGLGFHYSDDLAEISSVHRALDQLDLDTARSHLARPRWISSAPVGEALHAHLAATIGLYSGEAIRFSKAHQWMPDSTKMAGADPFLIAMSVEAATTIAIAAGARKQAQRIISAVPQNTPGLTLARARLSYALGQFQEVETLVSSSLMETRNPRHRGIAHGLRAAARSRSGRLEDAARDFDAALDCCVASSSLVPIAHMPKTIRGAFVEEHSSDERWKQIATSFVLVSTEGDVLVRRLLDLPETLVETKFRHELVDAGELNLLFQIDSNLSVSEIARDLRLAEGTVKNKLSALYKKLGVSNRRDAIDFGYRNGFFTNQQD